MKQLVALLLLSFPFYVHAAKCTDLSGTYELNDFYSTYSTPDCEHFHVADDFGTLAYLIDDQDHVSVDQYEYKLVTHNSWSKDGKVLHLQSEVSNPGGVILTSDESYQLLEDGSMKVISIDHFTGSPSNTYEYVLSRVKN